MLSLVFMAVILASCLAGPIPDSFSFSVPVGSGGGTPFATTGMGRVTAIRMWAIQGSYITGIQLRYGPIWSHMIGRKQNTVHEMDLYDGEKIIQVSGKYHPSNYIYQLVFVTSRGRFLSAGQPVQTAFNFYPTNEDAELRILSGRYNGNGITSLGVHWAMLDNNTTTDS